MDSSLVQVKKLLRVVTLRHFQFSPRGKTPFHCDFCLVFFLHCCVSCCTFLMASGSTAGFPVPQMQEGVDEREALDCFVMDYLDYCPVMGWFQRNMGCAYDDNTEDGRAQWKNKDLRMSTLCATLPLKIKRLTNPSNKTLGLSGEQKQSCQGNSGSHEEIQCECQCSG